MKKLTVLLVAAIMVLALTMPAAAFENEFGGYWRTRFVTQIGFTGEDQVNAKDYNFTDTRTRLFYTAKFSDNLKFVNKFEFNATWGQNKGYGQVGADNSGGDYFRVKNSYVDFKLGQQRFTVGVQDFLLARGYLWNDDSAGIKAIFKVNDAVYLPFIYIKAYEGGAGRTSGAGSVSNSDFDVQGYVFYPTIYLNKANTLKPHVSYLVTENLQKAQAKNVSLAPGLVGLGATELDLWSAGLEYDGKVGNFDLGATAIYQFGDVKLKNNLNGHDQLDVSAYLFDAFAGVNLGPANIHLKGIYASGNDAANDPQNSGELKGFLNPGDNINTGASYYWAEIMGAGIIDNAVPNGAPGDKISNVFIGNLGASYKLLQDLKFAADFWYAKQAENVYLKTINQYSDELGYELDLVMTYTIVDNLKIDLIGAYLWAGDVIQKSVSATGDENPYELAAQLSLAF